MCAWQGEVKDVGRRKMMMKEEKQQEGMQEVTETVSNHALGGGDASLVRMLAQRLLDRH